MILADDSFYPRSRLHLMYVGTDENGAYHILVSDGETACGAVRDSGEYWEEYTGFMDGILRYLCESCKEVLREHGGHVSHQDPTYRTEAGRSPRNGGIRTISYTERSTIDTVGFSEGLVYLRPGSRTQWDLIPEGEQRQVVLSAHGCRRYTTDATWGRRAVFNISRPPSGDGPIFLLGG